jgi:arylsulfatase A-like enzyme
MHIILYVLDALRADHLGCYGYERKCSPCIDALAHNGVIFETCFSSSTWTRPVAASILTGTYPGVHLARLRHDMFSSDLPRLPQRLQADGFKTVGFSAMGNLSSEVGFGTGFDHYYDLFRDPAILERRSQFDAARAGLMHTSAEKVALPLAEDINDFLFPWLDTHLDVNTFKFVWSIDPHAPYAAPDEFRRFSSSQSTPDEQFDVRSAGLEDRQRVIDLYDDEIFYNDHCIGQIVQYLEEKAIYEDTLFIVTGDHGDAFYEHGHYGHSHAPYEELIHVPLVIKFPGGQYAGRRVSSLVELVDIFPTILAVIGLPDAKSGDFSQGQNLLPLIEGTCNQVREYAFSDTQTLDVHNRYLSVRSQRWKYIQVRRPQRDTRTLTGAARYVLQSGLLRRILRSPRHFLRTYFGGSNEYLFDLDADPGEKNNLVAEHPDLVQRFKQVLADWEQRNAELAEQVSSLPYTYEESELLRDHLAQLGYL